MLQRVDLEDLLRARGAAENVIQFTHRLLAAATSSPLLLGESALAGRTATHTTRIADDVLQHWHRSGRKQPTRQYLDILHIDASEACLSLQSTVPVPVVQRWLNLLGTDCDSVRAPIVSPGDGQAFVAQIVHAVHADPTLSESALERCAMEVAALMIERQQSPRAVANALVQALSTKALNTVSAPDTIVRQLAYSERPHAVLLGVSGARELPGLDTAHPQVGLRQLHPDRQRQFTGWGNAGDRAQAFLRGVAAGTVDTGRVEPRSTSPHAFVSIHLDAPDTDAALSRARAALSEALDQYVVAHPAARLVIEPVAAAADPMQAGSFVVEDERGKPIDGLRPLAAPWPPIARIGLRMVSLMRASATSLTRAALCWVAMESIGIKPGPDSRQKVAKALALALLRQTCFRAYRDLVAAVGANSEERRRHERRAAVLRHSARKHLRIDTSIAAAERLHMSGMRRAAAAVLHAHLAVLADEEAQRRQGLLRGLAVAETNPTRSPPVRLASFDRWAELLRRSATEAPSSVGDHSVTALLTIIAPYQRTTIDLVRDMAADPTTAADFLRTRQPWMASLAAQLYVARNLHLHDGAHDLGGSSGLGLIAPLMINMLFEVWAAWFYGGSRLTPVEILDELERRFDICADRLSRGTLLENLDLAHMTGPTWSPRNP